ncbi:hypothetical protein BGZ70_000109 [Mortierella alpina]|uniref:PPM-type phosphatase domain-containing protein n=1 Tax=Mortierella alpina TaxID=64518 RepID=A0A9P6LYX6_MORAP|nr:hypothetical protein BGZ70_000109 [Mortierella alpina]
MTVPKSNEPLTTVSIVPMATSTKVHSYVRQTPVTSTSFQASQAETSRGDHNGRVSVQPTSFEGGLLVGLYDHESLSTQLDHSDDDLHHAGQNPNTCKIDPNQVIDTLKSTFLELDELLLATAITVALAQPDDTELASVDELKKTQEVIAQVVTGSTALVGFLAPHTASSSSSSSAAAAAPAAASTPHESEVIRHDLYLAHLGDSVAILAGLDSDGQWTARRLNPPETHEHSVRYLGSEEYRRVVSEAKERGLTAEQFLSQHHGHPSNPSEYNNTNSSNSCNSIEADLSGAHESFLTRGGKFLGLPVTRAFGDLDWKIEQEARYSVANWVEKSLRAKIDKALGGGHLQQQQQHHHQQSLRHDTALGATCGSSQDEVGINNLNDPPYVGADPQISRFVLETRKQQPSTHVSGPSDQQLILLSRGLLYRANSTAGPEAGLSSSSSSHTHGVVEGATGKRSMNPYDHPLMSDFDLSRIVAETLDKGDENCALAVARALQRKRLEAAGSGESNQGVDEEKEGLEGAVVVVVL